MVGQGARSTTRPRPTSAGSTILARRRPGLASVRWSTGRARRSELALRTRDGRRLRRRPSRASSTSCCASTTILMTTTTPGLQAPALVMAPMRARAPVTVQAQAQAMVLGAVQVAPLLAGPAAAQGAGLGWPRCWCGPGASGPGAAGVGSNSMNKLPFHGEVAEELLRTDGRERRGTAHRRRRERRGARLDLPRRVVVAENGASIHGSSTRSR